MTSNPTPLQKHVMFFDRNNDGKVTVKETHDGLVDLGVGKTAAWAQALFINGGLASRTQGRPSLTIKVENIDKAEHEGDSGTYDAAGKIAQDRFERIKTFDADMDGALSGSEAGALIEADKKSLAGTVASNAEFGLLLRLGADRKVKGAKGKTENAISFDRLKAFYEGTLFYKIAADRRAQRK